MTLTNTIGIMKTQFILYSNEFGFDIYYSDPAKYDGVITDIATEALVYESMPDITCSSVNRNTGYNFMVKFV